MEFEIIVPFYNGHSTIQRLIGSVPKNISISVIDDCSDHPYSTDISNVKTFQIDSKGYFSGAVNFGIGNTQKDVLILNQDVWLDGDQWLDIIKNNRSTYDLIGDGVFGHPAWPQGYVQGTFMWLSRKAINTVGLLDAERWPLWGATCEFQIRLCRAGMAALPISPFPSLRHERKVNQRFGSAISEILIKEPDKKSDFIKTPPLLSVIVPCHNYGRYIKDCINSLIGGPTSLGIAEPQTIGACFEIIIVDDASTDNSRDYIREVAKIEQGIRYYFLEENQGTAKTLNFGISKAVGKYITFLSADDMREPFSLQKLVEVCEQNPHSFVYDDVWLFHKNKRIKQWKLGEYDFETILYKNQVHAGIVFPRKAWVETGGYPSTMGDGREDWAFNIALGIKGWCGIHVEQYGYLYRREGQNRTETNTSEKHRLYFLNKIMDYFPEIYRGERPMACCGGGKKKSMNSKQSISAQSSMQRTVAMVGQTGMTKIEYTGNKMSASWHGETTHRDYIFGEDKPRSWVDNRDVGEKGKSGFLSKRDKNGNYLFRLVDAVSKSSEPEKEPISVESNETVTAMKGQAVGRSTDAILVVEEKKKLDFPDPTDMNVEEIKRLDLSLEQWRALYSAELAARNRKGAINFIEETLANWIS